MKAPRLPSSSLAILDTKVEAALRALLKRGEAFTLQDIRALEVATEETPPDTNPIQVVLYDLLVDLSYVAHSPRKIDVLEMVAAALAEIEAIVSAQLSTEVAPIYDAMQADPDRGVPATDVFDAIRDRHSGRGRRG